MPQYSQGYTLDDDLNVIPEVRAFVIDKRTSSWDELKPNHSYSQFIKTNSAKTWKHVDYH